MTDDKTKYLENFLCKARKIHGDKYDYSKFVYTKYANKGIIHCKKHNIDFLQSPSKHLLGHGCPKCRYENSAKHKMHDNEWFVDKARSIHGDKYDYSKISYKGCDDKLEIICHEKDEYGEEHGSFWMTPNNHLHKTKPQGCPKCGRIKSDFSRKSTTSEFIEKAKQLHGDKYDYSNVDYVGNKQKVCIVCPEHGEFWMEPTNHLMGQDCPRCAKKISNGEKEVYEFVADLIGEDNVLHNVRNILSQHRELDIYVPSKNLAIEYDGLIWHSEKYEKNPKHLLLKTEECLRNGIRLIHIFEDEWIDKNDIVKSRLNDILGYTAHKIYARKCQIREITSQLSREFIDNNHLQGHCKGKYHIGLYYNDDLVSVMVFGKLRQQKKHVENYDNVFELLRFANKRNTSVVGGASKLLKYFIETYKPLQIVTYADKRWSDGNLYEKLGFTHTHDSKPNYFYIFNQKRYNRFNFRKGQLVKQGYDSSKSEHQIMLERQMYRIYDCGTKVYVLNNDNN